MDHVKLVLFFIISSLASGGNCKCMIDIYVLEYIYMPLYIGVCIGKSSARVIGNAPLIMTTGFQDCPCNSPDLWMCYYPNHKICSEVVQCEQVSAFNQIYGLLMGRTYSFLTYGVCGERGNLEVEFCNSQQVKTFSTPTKS